MWNFWCLLSWVSEANILLQMGHRNCIPLLGCGGGSSGRRTLLGLFKLDLSFWRRFLRDMCFFFKLPFPGCKRSCNSEATVESFCGSSRPPRAIWVMMDHIKGVWYSLLLHPKTITQSNPLHMYFINWYFVHMTFINNCILCTRGKKKRKRKWQDAFWDLPAGWWCKIIFTHMTMWLGNNPKGEQLGTNWQRN